MEKYNWAPISNEDVKWWGVDFDNTLCHNTGYPDFIPKEPLEGAVEALKLIESKGFKIVIFTARSWADFRNIERWCESYGVPVRWIICGKPLLHSMYDDKNYGTIIDWKKVKEDYESYKPREECITKDGEQK